MAEVIICTSSRSFSDKEVARVFARKVCKEIRCNKFKLFKTLKGWRFNILYVSRK